MDVRWRDESRVEGWIQDGGMNLRWRDGSRVEGWI